MAFAAGWYLNPAQNWPARRADACVPSSFGEDVCLVCWRPGRANSAHG